MWAPPGPTLTLLMYWGLQQQEEEEGAEVSRRTFNRVSWSPDLHDSSHKSYKYSWTTGYLETLFQGLGFVVICAILVLLSYFGVLFGCIRILFCL